MREWYVNGHNIEPLKEAVHLEMPLIARAFRKFERDLERLKELREQVSQLELEGFDEEVRRLKTLLKDTGKIRAVEQGIAGLLVKVSEKYAIRLPVEDRRGLAEAIKGLPLGIPAAFWGVPMEQLVDELLNAERGLASDQTPVVKMKGKWYHADACAKEFLTPYKGAVESQKEVLARKSKLRGSKLDELIDKVLGPDGAIRRA
jgi:hypothetical protein